MAFYPTWQTDPSQGWQNQFIQQIPQNTPAITSLNSLDFQTQSYGYPSNGYVQTGLGFDPNYGRSPYGAPVQRYDFQSQQLPSAPINQVGLQGVGFAPAAVTYAGQVSATPTAPSVGLQQQQHIGSVPDLNKTMSGNDMPGYPRVSSVPPRSLNCNGYSGDYGGAQQPTNHSSTATSPSATPNNNPSGNTTVAAVNGSQLGTVTQNASVAPPAASPMQAPNTQTVSQSPTRNVMQQSQTSVTHQASRHIPQSPNQIPQSPNGNMTAASQQQQSYGGTTIPASPHHNVTMQPPQQSQNHISSPPQAQQHQQQQDWNWANQTQTSTDPYQQTGPGGERLNLNTRIKSMILRKNDPKDLISGTSNSDIHGMPGTLPPPPPVGGGNTANTAQQQQTGHFLSYSHHLRSETLLNANGSSSVPPQLTSQQPQQHQQQPPGIQTPANAGSLTAGGSLAPEPIGGGGDHIWKPHHTNSFKKPVSSGFQGTEHHHHHQQPQHTTTAHTEPKKSSRKSKSSRSSNSNSTDNSDIDKNSHDPGGGHHLSHLANMKMEKNPTYPPAHYTPQHPDYHTPYIKSEPGLLPGQHNKMEGYERNYQNFVQYADYCQNEVQTQPGPHIPQQPHHQSQQDYPTYHHNSGYYGSTGFQQNYQQNFMPGYQHATATPAFSNTHSLHSHHTNAIASHVKTMNGPIPKGAIHHHGNHLMEVDRKSDTSSIIPLPTNYEKDIPAHAYPIPPHRYPLGPPHLGPGMIEPKIEDMGTGYAHSHATHGSIGYPFHGEGGPAAIKGSTGFSCCRQGGTRAPTAEHLKDGSCIGMQTKDEILVEEEDQESNNGTKPKKKTSKPEENNEIVVKHEKINPMFDTSDRLEKGNKTEVPECDCFQSDKSPPEPGTYYTHLGTASNLTDLRKEFEERCQISGRQLRIEKIIYTGKEGKTSTGCPLAKWIIRRADPEEKILVVVKKRPGHRCTAAYIVVCMVAWEGMPRLEADNAYKNLIPKLNKFGLPTTRRCATNENRTCACQGLDPETSGASYSFGCSWSMYYNGCKYARSKTVRKFRLSVKSEEPAIEEHMNVLATVLAPLFKQICPRSYVNQTRYEKEAQDCRLGLKDGKPFSGVTACLDFCAHSHRDLHNMQDGCTVQVALLKATNRDSNKPDDEQLHVLPLYTMDTTDEFESMEGQREKHRLGAVQVLDKFPCEVRVRSTPLIPCRRHGKKRKEDETPPAGDGDNNVVPVTQPTVTPTPASAVNNPQAANKKDPNTNTAAPTNGNVVANKSKSKSKSNQSSTTTSSSAPPSTPSPRCQTPVTNNPSPAGSAFTTPPVSNNNLSNQPSNNNASGGNTNQLMTSNTSLMNMATMIDTFTDAQLQSNQISSTVLDSPYSYDYQTGSYIDSRNYYGNWPPPPHPHNPPHASAHNVGNLTGNGGNNIGTPTTANTPMAPPIPNNHNPTHHSTGAQHDPNNYNTNAYNNMPTAGSQQLTQVHDVRGEVKSRGSEENPDSTTLGNNNLSESKLTTLTPMTPMTNLTTQQHHPPHSHTNPIEEGFVKPKPPTDYQYSQYPNNYQMYPPPHSAYSAYDAYQNMNYNYGYHQAYSPYGMYPQQTPPPTPPPPSPNWNMYGHHQSANATAPATYSASTPLPPATNVSHHQPIAPLNNTSTHVGQTVLANGGNMKPVTGLQSIKNANTAMPIATAISQTPPQTTLTDISNPNSGTTCSDANNTVVAVTIETDKVNSGIPATSATSATTNNHNANSATTSSAPIETSTTTTSSANSNKIEPIGEVAEINDNLEALQDPQMGGVAIALNHGSVLIECAKHEMHATTALRRPNRHEPTRMTLIFYQHRNLNRTHHGIDEWEEKMRVKKINTDLDNKAKEEKEKLKKEQNGDADIDDEDEEMTQANPVKANTPKKEGPTNSNNTSNNQNKNNSSQVSVSKKKKESAKKNSNPQLGNEPKNEKVALRAPTLTTTSWTTLFPMHPCVVTGPYQEGNSSPTSTTAQQQQMHEQHQQPSQQLPQQQQMPS
uniref:Methylcytosine dioxygenase TET n=1 Tax=Glossina austeni TaxID=7395 RepID=A0A1A9UGC8_GLOAU